MVHKNMATGRLTQLRDIFLFCCFTGLSYAVVKKLRRWVIVIGIDGEQWINIKRQKQIPHPTCLYAFKWRSH